VNQAIVKAFDGVRVLEPWVVYLKPMHEDPELSWFETTGKAAENAVGPSRRRRLGSWFKPPRVTLSRWRSAQTVSRKSSQPPPPKP
jgi:hypothetical protein